MKSLAAGGNERSSIANQLQTVDYQNRERHPKTQSMAETKATLTNKVSGFKVTVETRCGQSMTLTWRCRSRYKLTTIQEAQKSLFPARRRPCQVRAAAGHRGQVEVLPMATRFVSSCPDARCPRSCSCSLTWADLDGSGSRSGALPCPPSTDDLHRRLRRHGTLLLPASVVAHRRR